MLFNNLALIWTGACLATLAFAERPTLPPNGEDTRLTHGKSAAQFFAERATQSTCRGTLEKSRQEYRTLRMELNALVAKQAPAAQIDSKEQQVTNAQYTFLGYLEKCGECATHRMEHRTVDSENSILPEYWSIADGSCFLPQKYWQDLNGFDRAMNFLKNIGTYPGKRGGFHNIIEFIGENDPEGKPKTQVDHSPFHAFIVVRGPDTPLGLMAFSYPFINHLAEGQKTGKREFTIRFTSEEAHPSVQIPSKIYDQSASGKQTRVDEERLEAAMGMWLVDSNGYMRYYTAGNFGALASFGDDFARRTLLSTLSRLAEVLAGVENL